MGMRMEEALFSMNLSRLSDRCASELNKHRRKLAADERFCLEIFRRAIIEHVDQAWSVLQQCFEEVVRIWLRSHSSQDVALRRDSEENYVAQTFSRFWYAVRTQHIEFQTLNSALSYLHATLNGIIMDTMRSQLRSKNVPLPDPGFPEEPSVEDSDDGHETWEAIQKLLTDERETQLAYLLYYCGFKPREIVTRYPQEFNDVKEVYRLNCNIVDRLRRNRDRLRWLLGEEEG